jgi:hypothetical protein
MVEGAHDRLDHTELDDVALPRKQVRVPLADDDATHAYESPSDESILRAMRGMSCQKK